MTKREVCGAYPGAVPWATYGDEPPAQLAAELARSAGCAYYTVDGVTYGPFDESAEETETADLRSLLPDVNSSPFGLDDPTRLAEPFCACGHVTSRCDGSRRDCGKRKAAP